MFLRNGQPLLWFCVHSLHTRLQLLGHVKDASWTTCRFSRHQHLLFLVFTFRTPCFILGKYKYPYLIFAWHWTCNSKTSHLLYIVVLYGTFLEEAKFGEYCLPSVQNRSRPMSKNVRIERACTYAYSCTCCSHSKGRACNGILSRTPAFTSFMFHHVTYSHAPVTCCCMLFFWRSCEFVSFVTFSLLNIQRTWSHATLCFMWNVSARTSAVSNSGVTCNHYGIFLLPSIPWNCLYSPFIY